MKFKSRTLTKTIKKAIKTFPAVVITGPRQSGKTTLLKKLFLPRYTFVSLEDPDIRMRAKKDPKIFLSQYKTPIIIDEIQYFPELLSYIKTRIDEDRKPGQWLITGSQNFVLMHNVSQSLAGRAAVLSLLPFSLAEQMNLSAEARNVSSWLSSIHKAAEGRTKLSLSDVLLRGLYPEIAANKSVDRQLWCSSYITTYLERDVRNLSTIGDLGQFEHFLHLCAANTGQILNISSMARDIGISVPTAKRWLSLLETSYLVFLLYPYYKNIGKRIIKSPKMYFIDPALCSYLMGYHDNRTLQNSRSFGAVFETFIVCDILKKFLHTGERPSMYYLRSQDGLEVDLIIEIKGKLHLFEIKSAMTITPKHASSLKKLKNSLRSQIKTAGIISCAEDSFPIEKGIDNFSWKDILLK